MMKRKISSPWGEKAMEQFLDGFLYEEKAFLIDQIIEADAPNGMIQARLDTKRELLVAPYQKGDPTIHPRHVAGADMVMVTVGLGCLHAYFFHNCLWKDGWVGFGSRMREVQFKNLAHLGPPVSLRSRELRHRKGPNRVLIEFEFLFEQEEKVVYQSQQSAMFVRDMLPKARSFSRFAPSG